MGPYSSRAGGCPYERGRDTRAVRTLRKGHMRSQEDSDGESGREVSLETTLLAPGWMSSLQNLRK